MHEARRPPGACVYPGRFVRRAHHRGLHAQAALLHGHTHGRRHPLHARAQPPARPDHDRRRSRRTRRMCRLRWLPGQHGARRARRPAAIAHRRRPLSRRAALEPDGTALASTRHDRHADASHQRGRHRALGPHRPGHADSALPVAWRLPGHARRLRLGRVLRRWQRSGRAWPKRSAATPNAGFARSR